MSAMKSQKRKNKKKYFQSSKKSKCAGLESGMKGFLITCNDEHRCLKEAYNLLNEFADEIYGPEFVETTNEDSEVIDIKEQLAKEISAIKAKRRFQQVFTKVKGILFINTTVPDPAFVVNKIFERVLETGKKKTRFILKLKPVAITCKAYESDIRKALDEILLNYSSKEENRELKYKVESKIRHNDNITSAHLIWYVRDSVNSVTPKWTACILEPKVLISFDVLGSICCISILDKYEEYRKYNLSIVVEPVAKSSELLTITGDTKVPKIVNEDESIVEATVKNSETLTVTDDTKVPEIVNEDESIVEPTVKNSETLTVTDVTKVPETVKEAKNDSETSEENDLQTSAE